MGRKFFLFCAGANNNILDQLNPQLKESESIRLAGTGAVIFITALFAFVSSCYALSTVFPKEEIKTYLASFLWAAFIFSIDRLLISSFIKSNLSSDNLKFFLPRLGLAVIIGVVVAHPLELRIFEKEVNEYLKNKQTNTINNIQSKYQKKITTVDSEDPNDPDSPTKSLNTQKQEYEKNKQKNESEINKLRQPIIQAEKAKNCEASGNEYSEVATGNLRTCDGQRRAARGPKFRELRQEWLNLIAIKTIHFHYRRKKHTT